MTISQRIAQTFIRVGREHGVATDEGLLIPRARTYWELRLVGVDDQEIHRILRSWLLSRVIQTSAGMLQLADLSALQRMADGERYSTRSPAECSALSAPSAAGSNWAARSDVRISRARAGLTALSPMPDTSSS